MCNGVFEISFRSGTSSRGVVVEEEGVSDESGNLILEFERDRAGGFWDCR